MLESSELRARACGAQVMWVIDMLKLSQVRAGVDSPFSNHISSLKNTQFNKQKNKLNNTKTKFY